MRWPCQNRLQDHIERRMKGQLRIKIVVESAKYFRQTRSGLLHAGYLHVLHGTILESLTQPDKYLHKKDFFAFSTMVALNVVYLF